MIFLMLSSPEKYFVKSYRIIKNFPFGCLVQNPNFLEGKSELQVLGRCLLT